MTFSKWWLVVAGVSLIGFIALLFLQPVIHSDKWDLTFVEWVQQATVAEVVVTIFFVAWFVNMMTGSK